MSDIDEKIAKLEEARAKRKAEASTLEKEQYAKDLEARIKLEEEYGEVAAVKVSRFQPGVATVALVRMPKGDEYKRYKDQLYRSVDKKNTTSTIEAQNLLAKSCWVYPVEKEARDAMLEAFPGILSPIAMAAAALAEGRAEEEGKG